MPHEITAVIREAAYLGLYSLLATQDAMSRANGRRLTVLREAIELYEAGPRGRAAAARSRWSRASGLKGSPARW